MDFGRTIKLQFCDFRWHLCVTLLAPMCIAVGTAINLDYHGMKASLWLLVATVVVKKVYKPETQKVPH